ncbi:ECF transporter S component [Furfurilactobacillus milii]|nr:ECF transporter S component [Furfurilactobacillus milii]
MDRSTMLRKSMLAALLLALCVVGANLKIMGSIALDSAPAFLGAILLGPWFGAFLGFFGNMVSAALSGFPLTVPVHLVIGLNMAFCMFVFGVIRRRWGSNQLIVILIADLVAYVIDVSEEFPWLYPLIGKTVFALFIPLTVATIANLALTEVVYVAIPNRQKQAFFLQERQHNEH